jgi:hypothetical protein
MTESQAFDRGNFESLKWGTEEGAGYSTSGTGILGDKAMEDDSSRTEKGRTVLEEPVEGPEEGHRLG